ncbi:MAG: M14 family metallopeptidase [Acidobacteriota bacterium]
MTLRRSSLLLLALFISLGLGLTTVAHGDDPSGTAILPPLPPWSGESRALIVADDDPWVTPAELADFDTSPSYLDTMAYLKRLAAAAPQIELISLGTSLEGRELWLAVVSKEGVKTPEALRANGRPTLFAQSGIHSGEIDGKDAGLMLLRDLTVAGTKSELLDRANLLFVPIFGVDAHELDSPYERMNQRGPSRTGRRPTPANLNLNRDYAKVDTVLMQMMVDALKQWDPALYVDLHVTDGVDHQYDVTWAYSRRYSPAIRQWLETVFDPRVTGQLEAAGHIPGPFFFAADGVDPANGIYEWSSSTPRYSDGWGDARHLPTLLVENHALKPYEQRVLGTYVLLESMLDTLGEHGAELIEAIDADRARRADPVPLAHRVPETPPTRTMTLRGIKSEMVTSKITGAKLVRWTGEPMTYENVPIVEASEVVESVTRPRAYWVPAIWRDVIDRLARHGIEMERIDSPRTLDVKMYRLENPELAGRVFESHVRVSADVSIENKRWTFAAGSVRVPTDQPLGTLAVLLLEPRAPDSFFQWGFFNAVLQQTGYYSSYVMAPMAERMLEADPELRTLFEKKLEDDPDFAASPRARLDFFYERTPFFDDRWLLYPVAREE